MPGPGIAPGMQQVLNACVELVSGGGRKRFCRVALRVRGSLPAECQAATCSEGDMAVFLWTSASGGPCGSSARVTQPHCLFIRMWGLGGIGKVGECRGTGTGRGMPCAWMAEE